MNFSYVEGSITNLKDVLKRIFYNELIDKVLEPVNNNVVTTKLFDYGFTYSNEEIRAQNNIPFIIYCDKNSKEEENIFEKINTAINSYEHTKLQDKRY